MSLIYNIIADVTVFCAFSSLYLDRTILSQTQFRTIGNDYVPTGKNQITAKLRSHSYKSILFTNRTLIQLKTILNRIYITFI